MSPLLQDIIIWVAVGLAAGYLFRRYVYLRKSRGCSACRLHQISREPKSHRSRQPRSVSRD